MNVKQKQRCSALVYSAWLNHSCFRNAIVIEDGKPWCRQHAPSLVKARREAQDAKWAEENKASNERWQRIHAKETAVGHLSTADLESPAFLAYIKAWRKACACHADRPTVHGTLVCRESYEAIRHAIDEHAMGSSRPLDEIVRELGMEES